MGDLVRLLGQLDDQLGQWVQAWGPWAYVILALIAFSQTGLVLGPALPGATILFAAGILAAGSGAALSLPLLIAVCLLGVLVGNQANYIQGARIGRRVFERKETGLLSRASLAKTESFFEKNGKWAMVVAPFVPFIRSFAPFVAGMAKMDYGRYTGFAAMGGTLWVVVHILAGAFLGNIPAVRENLGFVLIGVFALVTGKMLHGLIKSRRPAPESV
jgi:membrane-associated protein